MALHDGTSTTREPALGALTFRPVRPEEEALLFELYSAVRAQELHLDDWDPAARHHMLRLQFDAQRRGYREQFPAADERLILREGATIGWVVVDRSGAALHGIDIALLSGERSRGVGSAIIRALQDEAAAEGRPMVITVLRGNVRALELYVRLGFRTTGETDLHINMEWVSDRAIDGEPR